MKQINYKLMKSILIILVFINCTKNQSNAEIETQEDISQYHQKYMSYIVKAQGGLRMRKLPDPNSDLILTVPENSVVFKVGDSQVKYETDKLQGTWVKVVYKLNFGYVFSGFLKENSSPKNLINYLHINEGSHLSFTYDVI